MTYSSYYCRVTNQPKLSGMNNNYSVFMDSVYQNLGKSSVGCLSSVPSCLELSWEDLKPGGDYESLKSFEGLLTHMFGG